MNKLYFGDCLNILKNPEKIPGNYVDLVYLDPPFKSGRNYNILFQPERDKIKGATAQIRTFEDTWHWGDEAEEEYLDLIKGTLTSEKPPQKLIELMKSLRSYLGEVPIMAYLTMMAPRLLEMRRVMKKTGSIYLHCDPTASHYLKLLMDAVFNVANFQNEILWCYEIGARSKKRFGRKHDVILFYTKSDTWNFYWREVAVPRKEGTHMKTRKDKNGRIYQEKTDAKSGKVYRYYLDEGAISPDWWLGIQQLNREAAERTGYPTQKPELLLEKILKASSQENDVILDPFCGCGTTIAVAEKLRRQWIGIDVTYLAIDVIKKRLLKNNIGEGIHFEVDGDPKDVYSARKFAERDRFQFQVWCILMLNATPNEKKTGDEGIDGIINFVDRRNKTLAGKGIISVKSDKKVAPWMVRELAGTVTQEHADFGVLVTLSDPTPGMVKAKAKEGFFQHELTRIPKLQILTVADLFKKPIPIILPKDVLPPYKKPVIKKENQEKLFKDTC